MSVSIRSSRNNFSALINDVEKKGITVVLTRFGKPKAMLVPFAEKKRRKAKKLPFFGMWKHEHIASGADYTDAVRDSWKL